MRCAVVMSNVCKMIARKTYFRWVLRCACAIEHLSLPSLKNGDRKIKQLSRMTSGPMKIEGATNSVSSDKHLPK